MANKIANEKLNDNKDKSVSFIKALGSSFAILVVCIGMFIGLGKAGISTVWLGFLYLYYFGAIKHFQWAAFPTAFVGGLIAVLLNYALPLSGIYFGQLGQQIWLVLLMLVIAIYIHGKFKWITDFTMLLTAIFGIPHLAKPQEFVLALITYALFTIIIGLISYIMHVKSTKATQSAGM
jgi:hypothetical protein